MMSGGRSPAELLTHIEGVPMGGTVEDQWQAQILARILKKHEVILVCSQGARGVARNMGFLTAGSANEAFTNAAALIQGRLGDSGTSDKKLTVTVIPDGVSVIVESAGK